MFSRSTCGYCRVQWPIIQRFQEEMGWQVTLWISTSGRTSARGSGSRSPDDDGHPRGSQQRMIIASGVEAYPNLAQMAYQAVRLLRGDIRPEQFMTGRARMPASSMRWATARYRRPIPVPSAAISSTPRAEAVMRALILLGIPASSSAWVASAQTVTPRGRDAGRDPPGRRREDHAGLAIARSGHATFRTISRRRCAGMARPSSSR
jgi:hypothetical protein